MWPLVSVSAVRDTQDQTAVTAPPARAVSTALVSSLWSVTVSQAGRVLSVIHRSVLNTAVINMEHAVR